MAPPAPDIRPASEAGPRTLSMSQSARPSAGAVPSRWKASTRAQALLAMLVVASLALAVVAMFSGHSPPIGAGRITVQGRVLVGQAGRQQAVTGTSTLQVGDEIDVTDGSAKIDLGSNRSLELRTLSQVRIDRIPVLLAGDALAVAAEQPVDVQGSTGTVTVTGGAARLTQGLGISVATYQGRSMLTSAGRTLVVPRLRQASVPDLGVLTSEPTALLYREDDPWDRRYLTPVFELTGQLNQRSRGFTAQLAADEGHTVGFYELVVPKLRDEPAFTAKLSPSPTDRVQAPGENLVAAVVSLGGVQEQGGFAERWARVFRLRSEGGTWGLVAVDLGAFDVRILTADIDAAIGRQLRPTVVAAPATATATATTTTPATTPKTTQTTTNRPDSAPTSPKPTVTTPKGTKPTTPPGSTTLPVTPLSPILDPLLDPLVDPLVGPINDLIGPGGTIIK